MPDAERHALLRSIVSALGDEGILGGIVDQGHGGLGLTYMELAAAVEEASAHSQVVASLLAFASASIGTVLTHYGTEEQIDRYLVPTLKGEQLAAMGFTEPGGGSDVANMATLAVPEGEGYLLKGEKVWVDWSPEADWFIVFAQADPDAGRRGITAFLLPRTTDGVSTSSMGRKLGFREYTTGRIRFHGCHVSDASVLGDVGQGLSIARIALEDARVFVAARLCGSLWGCLHQLRSHAALLGVSPSNQMYLSVVTDLAIALDCSRNLTYAAARLKDAGRDAGIEAAQAKLVASEALGRLSTAVVGLLGPDSLIDSQPAARLFRDSKVSGVTAGSDEIMRGSIARHLLGS